LNQEVEDFDPNTVARNFKWESDNLFRIINSEGFEKLISITSGGDWKIKDSTFVPMKDLLNLNQQSMYYFDSILNKRTSTFQRLLVKY